MATKLTATAATAMANALNTAAGSGAKIVIYGYSGSAISEPVNASDTATGITLATFTLGTNAFGSASNGQLSMANGTGYSLPLTVTAAASGTAVYFRLMTSANAVLVQGTVGTSGQQLNLNTLTLTSGVNVTITSGTITMPLA